MTKATKADEVELLGKRHWGGAGTGVGGSWNRVLYSTEVLLGNCTDPKADTLEWRPDIRAWLGSQNTTEDVDNADIE